jgi:hypothetical protein
MSIVRSSPVSALNPGLDIVVDENTTIITTVLMYYCIARPPPLALSRWYDDPFVRSSR